MQKKLQYQINEELSKVDNWLKTNRLIINIAKSNYSLFTYQNTYTEFYVFIGSQRLPKQVTSRYLGACLDYQLKWHKHISPMETKLAFASGILYKLNKYLPSVALLTVYYSVVYSHLLYGWYYELGRRSLVNFK